MLPTSASKEFPLPPEQKPEKRRSVKNLFKKDLPRPNPPKTSPKSKEEASTPRASVEKEKEGLALKKTPLRTVSLYTPPPAELSPKYDKPLNDRLISIALFLNRHNEKGVFFRKLPEYHPVLSDEKNLEWRIVPANPSDIQARINALALKYILDHIVEAYTAKQPEFLVAGKVKDVQEFRALLAEHSHTKNTILKSATLLELWRKTFLKVTSASKEFDFLTKMSPSIKFILELFIKHQKREIASLKEQGLLLHGGKSPYPHLTETDRKKKFEHVFTAGLTDEEIYQTCSHSPETVLVGAADYKAFKLNDFFETATANADAYRRAVEPLHVPPPFTRFIDLIKEKKERKEYEEQLKNEQLSLITAKLAGPNHRLWSEAKERLPTALIALATRGFWLLEQRGNLSERVLRSKETLAQLTAHAFNYHQMEEILLKITQVLEEQAP